MNEALLKAFLRAKSYAKVRGIPWQFDFEGWLRVWTESGHLAERGKFRGQFVMARFGDKGPYRADNVRIVTVGENVAEANGLKKYRTSSVLPPFVRHPVQYMTSADLRALRARLDETQAQFATRIGVNRWTLRRWERKGPPQTDLVARALERVRDEVDGGSGPDAAGSSV